MKITDDLTKKLAKAVSEIMQSGEEVNKPRSKKEEEFVKLHTDNVNVVDLSPDEKPFQDAPKQKEEKQPKAQIVKEEKGEEACEKMSDEEIDEALSKSAPASEWIKDFVHSNNPKFKGKSKEERIKMALGAYYGQKESMNESVLMEAPVKSDQWIKELANVVARSSDTKDLTMAFEAWANSLYKTPTWQSITRTPIVGLLVDELATALDVYIGYSAESTAEVEDSQIEEAAGKYALSVDGKIWSKSGKPVHFANAKSAKSAQSKASEKMKDKKVEVVKLEEAAADDTTEVEKAWKASKDKKPVIKKYGLAQGISSLRPGEIKLGIRNQMNGKRSFAALDDKGDLIVISGTNSAPKIRYVK